MDVHLAFVKLDHDDESADVAGLVDALKRALQPFGAEVMPPADDQAAAAWDVAVLVRGADVDAARAAITKALDGMPIGAAKGWTFAGRTS